MTFPKFPGQLAVILSLAAIGMGCASTEREKADAGGRTFAETLPWVKDVGAKRLPSRTAVFRVNDHGATNDGVTLNTRAIQAAIDAAAAAGGGIVTFAPGRYLSGSLFVKSGVHLRIDRDVELLGSQDIADYPDIDTRVAGIEMRWPAGLINVDHQDTVAVTGEGTVHAQGKPFWDLYWNLRRDYQPKGLRWASDYDAKRPRTIVVANSTNVTVAGLTLKQAAFWTVHILYSTRVTCDGLVIRNNVDGHGPSTDGIDIDSSSWVLVENCDIDCNDDDFCIKSGRDADGLRVNRPTEYVVIRDSIARAGGGLITFGSETSGGFRHILAHNLRAEGTQVGIRFKSALTRGGVVEDIYLEDIVLDGVPAPVEIGMNWNPTYSYATLPEGMSLADAPAHWKPMLQKTEPPERGIPVYRNVHISRVRGTGGRVAINATGLPESAAENFHFRDVVLEAERAGHITHARRWTFRDVRLLTTDTTPLRVTQSEDMHVPVWTE